MSKQCTYRGYHSCDIWIDYQVTLDALEEAAELCSLNWEEIQYLQSYIEHLEMLLKEAGIAIH